MGVGGCAWEAEWEGVGKSKGSGVRGRERGQRARAVELSLCKPRTHDLTVPNASRVCVQAVKEFKSWHPTEQVSVLGALDVLTAGRIMAQLEPTARARLLAGVEPHVAANILAVSMQHPAWGHEGMGMERRMCSAHTQ